jgi:alpha-L-arabinofuranosidase
LRLAIEGVKLASHGHLWRMAPSSVDATITVGQKPEVALQEQELTSLPNAMAVPPFSVTIYSFAVQ